MSSLPDWNILITGASGFLGGWLVREAIGKGVVHALYRRRKPALAGARWHRCDLSRGDEVEDLFAEAHPSVVIHAAAEANLDWCERNPELARAANVVATELVAECCREVGARLIYVSTDMVFDGKKGWYAEDDPVSPISLYGRTKADAERVVRERASDWVVARTALMYGDPAGGGSSFSVWLESQLLAGETVGLFVDQYRTPLFVRDAARALLELAASSFQGTIHLAGPDRLNRYEFGLILAEGLNLNTGLIRRAKLDDVPLAAPRPRDLSLRTDLARATLKTAFLSPREAVQEMARLRKQRADGLGERGHTG